MAARFFTRLSVVLMCNLKVFDAVEQANRMTDADQETRRRDGLRFSRILFRFAEIAVCHDRVTNDTQRSQRGARNAYVI